MARLQPVRGNPEAKISTIFEEFSGGINLVDSDDTIGTNQLRHAQNVSFDSEGTLKNRKGWLENPYLSSILTSNPGNPLEAIPAVIQYDVKAYYSNREVKFTNESETLTEKMYLTNKAKVGDSCTLVFNVDTSDTTSGMEVRVTVGDSYEDYQDQTQFRANIEMTLTQEMVDAGYVEYSISKIFSVGYFNAFFRNIKFVATDQLYLIEGEPIAREILGLFVLKDKYNQLPSLINGLEYAKGDTKIAEYNLGTNTPILSENPPMVFIVLWSDFNNRYYINGHFHTNSPHYTGTFMKTYPLNSTFFEGDVARLSRSLMSVSVITSFQKTDELIISLEGIDCLIGIKDSSVKGVSALEINSYGKDIIPGDKWWSGTLENKAYKPTPMEIRRVGFNVLGSNPLTWIGEVPSTANTIHGMFLTIGGNKPIYSIPTNKTFIVHVMRQGSMIPSIKFYEWVDGDRIEVPYIVEGTYLNNSSMYALSVTLLASTNNEIEISVTLATTPATIYRDIYDVDLPSDRDPKEVPSLTVSKFKTIKVYDRLVLFGGNTIWYSDFTNPAYIPNYNYLTLPFDENKDEIVNITFFRSSYMIFTRNSIYKLSGGFDISSMAVDLVSENIGCIAPNTVKMVNNELIFLSNIGLYSLKSETFRQDMENVRSLENKIYPIFDQYTFEDAVAITTDDQYILYLGNAADYNLLSKKETFKVGNRNYLVPDMIRYYYNKDSFVFDVLPDNEYLLYIQSLSHTPLTFRGDKVYTLEESARDFNIPYEIFFETAGVSLGYPAHEKKVKKMWVKMNKDLFTKGIKFDIYMDGILRHTITEFTEGDVGVIALGDSNSDQRMLRLPSLKGRNFTIRCRVEDGSPIDFNTISLEWKLGKMRG